MQPEPQRPRESPYAAPKAALRGLERGRASRFRLLAPFAGLFALLLTYMATGTIAALAVGIRTDEALSFQENVVQAQGQLGILGQLGMLPVIIIPLVVGGLVAAKLGRPRYIVHAASVGALLTSLFLGVALLLMRAYPTISFRHIPFTILGLFLLPMLGGWIARWHERSSS